MIPFVGAAIVMRSMPDCVEHEAMVAIAGPIAGGATAFGIATCGQMFDSQLAFALADFGKLLYIITYHTVSRHVAAAHVCTFIDVNCHRILYAAVVEHAVHNAVPTHQMSKY
jgi:hypothetical protein